MSKDTGKNKNINSESIDQRRRAVHKIVVGTTVVTGASLLPTSWKKPVIDTIVVPAHAQMSATTTPAATTTAQVTTTAEVTTTAQVTTTAEVTTTTEEPTTTPPPTTTPQCPQGYVFDPSDGCIPDVVF